MPVVNIPNFGPVSFPEGMSEKQIRAEAQRMAQAAAEKTTYKPDYRDLGIGQLMYGGLRRAASGLGSTVTDLLPALIGAGFGQDEYARQQLEEAAQKQKEIRERFPTAFGTYKDIRGIGDAPEYIAESLGELTPDIVAMLTGAGTLGAVGRRAAVKGVERAAAERAAETAAKKQMDEAAAAAYADRLKQRAVARQADEIAKTKDLAQGTGLYGVSLGLNAPDTFESVYEKTGSLEPVIALAFGAAQSALDSIIPARILGQFSPAVKSRAAAELAQQSSVVPQSIKVGIAKELAKTGAGEAATESVQELLGVLAEKTAGATGEVFGPETIDRMINAGLKGLIGGTAFGAPGAIAKGIREATPTPPTVPTAEAPTPPTPAPPATTPIPPTAAAPTEMEGVPRVESVLPSLAEETAPAPEPEAAVEAEPTVGVKGVPDITSWTTEALQKQLQAEMDKPRDQNAELITAITDELLRRSADKGEPRAKTVSPIPPEYLTPPTPPQQPATERPVAAPAGESVSVPSGPPTGGAPTGVEAPESGAVVRRGESVEPPTAGAAVQPPTLEPAAPPPPPTPTAAPEGVSRETLIEDFQRILTRKRALLTSDNREPFRPRKGKPPSPERAEYEAVEAELEQKLKQWKDLTGADFDPALLEKPAPAPAPAPAPPTIESKTPASFAADIVAGKKLDTPEDVQFYQNNAAEIEAELKKLAPAPAPAPAKTSDDLMTEISGLESQRMALLRKDGKVPFPNSPARKKYDALVDQIADLKYKWNEADKAERATKAKTAEPTPPTQEELTTEEQADLQAELDEAQGAAPTPAPSPAPAPTAPKQEAKKRGRPKKVLTEEEQKAKAEQEAEKAKKQAEREAKAKAEREEQERLKGVIIETTYTDKSGKRVTERMTPEEVDEALKAQEKAAAVFGENERGGYDAVINDSVQRLDRPILLNLVSTKRELNEEAAAAKAYFSKTRYATNALYDLAFDLANALRATSGTYRKGFGEGTIEAERFAGTGGKQAVLAAQWVRDSNLTAKTKALFDKYLSQHKLEAAKSDAALAEFTARQEQQRAYEEAAKQTTKAGLVAGLQATETELKDLQAKAERQTKAAAERRAKAKKEIQEKLGGEAAYKKAMGKAFAADELVGLDYELDAADIQADRETILRLDVAGQFALPLHPVVRQSLMQGDLKQALRFLAADYGKGTTADLARLYERVLTTTDVVTVNELTDESGRRVPGYYDPKINTIFLDSVDGMNNHALFHELGHALTSHVLANPSHPVTRQLTQLFNDVKGSLDTAYGATSLDEFVAESWSNEEFKGKLNAINPKGEKITAWQRFVNAIRNLFRSFMGKPTASLETAFDRVDTAIKAIISNAPESRDAELLYAATVTPRAPFVASTLNSIGRAASALPGVNSAQGQRVLSKAHEFFKNTLGKTGRNILNSLLPLDAYTDMVESTLPGAKRVNEVVNEKHGDEGIRNQKIEPTVQFAETWAAKASPKAVELFNTVVYESTLEKIDPTRPRSFYEDKFAQAPAIDLQNALETWDRLNADLQAANKEAPGAIKLYNLMRNSYMELYNEIVSSIGARIDESVSDPEVRKKVKNELFQKLIQRGAIDPYFPLTRNGDYWLRFDAKDRYGLPNLYVEAYETERERNQAIAELKKLEAQGEVSNIQSFSNISELSYRNTPPTSFVNSVLKTLELHRATIKDPDDANKFDRAIEGVMRMYLTTLPETSFAQSFQRRKDRLGFSKDSIRAFREKTYSLSRQLSNMKYAAKLYEQSDKLREYVRKMSEAKGEDNQTAKEYFDELQKRINFAASPTVSQWAQLATTFGFNYLLGFNVSSALINMTQIPLIVTPYLGGRYKYPQASKAIAEATKIYMGSGFSRTAEMIGSGGEKVKVKAMPSLDNYDFDAKDTPKNVKKYKTLAEVAAKMGQLNRSQLYDILDVDGRKNPIAALNAVGGFAFHHAERMNRQVTLMAAYSLELERLEKDRPDMNAKDRETLAAQTAITIAETTNGGVSAASAPRISQNSLGRVLFMFKRYGVSMYYMLFKMTREIMQNQDPAVRKAAFKQLAGVYGTTALISGLQGVPMFGVLAMIYNMFKDDDDENLGSVVRGYSGEMIYKGLINYATGLSVAERTGLSDLLFRDSPYSSGSTSLAESFAQILGGPIYGIASRIQRGVALINEGEMQRGIESMSPVALASALKAIRYATEGANTLRGDPIIGDIGPWNIAAQFFGFTPAEYTRQLEQNAMLKGIEKAVIQEKTKQLKKLFTSSRMNDADGYNKAMSVLEELYAEHPGLGNLQETIRRSAAQHERTTQNMYHGIVLNKKLKEEMLGYVEDWD